MVNSSAQVKTGAWDPEEDDLLYYWQSKVGNKWSEVAKHIPGRTGQQCAQRWRHKVNPNIRRDKWTPEEDAKLIELVKTFGVGRWAEIARNCDGRTDQQCMGRWRRHLDPSIRRDSWSPEEDAKLRQLHAQYGTSWSRISKCLKGRTSQQCRARWHQINNGKGGSKPSAAPAAAAGVATSTAGKRGSAAGKRKTARRRSDFTDSEDEEEPEDDIDDYEDEYEDRYEDEAPQQQQYQMTTYTAQHDLAAAAAAAADAAAAEIAYSLEMPVPGTAAMQQLQLQHPEWSSAWAATAAAAVSGHVPCDGVAYEAQQEADGDSGDEEGSDDVDYAPSAVEPRGSGRYSRRRRYSTAASHSKPSIPPGSSRFGPQSAHQREQGEWMPSSQKLLLSPDRPQRPGCLQQQAKADSTRELDEEETAGAETLLQMAHLLRRESCDFEPPSLRRSDFITASTPPKRTTQDRPDLRNSDELSPSPFKRARSSRGALFGASAAAEQDSSVAPAHAAGRAVAPVPYRDEDEAVSDDEEQPFVSSGGCAQQQQEQDEQDQVDADADSYMDPEVEAATDDDFADEAADILGMGLANSSYEQPLPDPARPSNASCLTVAGAAAAAFLSPPPVTRVPGSSSRWNGGMATPRRPTAQQNLMNLLGSPSFDRMPGYASPPSAGKTQPSAATLAALQSPQPSCVHEPFWTPFTGLVKDGVFTRGTTGTPDLPSAGKGRSSAGGLFSPVRRSGSTGKAIPRRNLIASPAERAAEALTSSQHTEESGEGAAAAGCSGMDHDPSPACGLQQQAQQVNHRVVRRLDQHEAWGARSNPSPSKPPLAARAKDSSTCIGFSLFSPVKKQPVPLFNESNITIGTSPAKPSTDVNLTITPLQHNLPSSSEQPSSPTREPAVCSSPSGSLPHGKSPLGAKAAGRLPVSSTRRSAAARSLLSPVHSKIVHKRLEQHLATQVQQEVQAAPAAAASQQQQEGGSEEDSPMAISPAEVQAAQQQQQQQEGSGGQPQLEAQGSAVPGRQASNPDTPVHSKQGPDNSSCSGTPNTPAGQQQQLGSLSAAAAEASPSNFVTPQQRQRPSRPLAPLHKDCLIAAATRSAAGPAGQTAPTGAAAGGVEAHNSSSAPAGASGVVAAAARTDSTTPGKAASGEESGTSGSAPGSADSSKLLSPDRFMDSPLQVAAQQLQSPSQWHQGMVMLMRNLQQTPLQVKAQGDDCSKAGCEAKAAGETAGVRAGSRALRRLQAELERGSSTVAVQQLQQQQFDKDKSTAACDLQVPFSSAAVPAVSAACASTPMLLPLFSHVLPPGAGDDHCSNAAVSMPLATPAAAGRSNAVLQSGSVSLVPAVINCSKAELMAMQGPGAATVAWPVQQRPDGGLVVSAAMPASDVATAAVLQLTPPAVTVGKERSSLQSGRTGTAGPAAEAYTPAGASSNTVPGSSGGRMTVVSIQPVTMMMGSSQQPGLSAMPSMYHPMQQPARSVAVASAVSMPERFINSHAVRSRLHALIDGV